MNDLEKPFYQSKRFYVNFFTIVFVIAQFFGFTPNEAIATLTTNILIAVVPVINLILARISKKPLGLGVFKRDE